MASGAGDPVTRQEFVDAVAEVIGMRPGVEEQVGTIVLLGDAYAATRADAVLHPQCRCGCGRPVAYKRLRLAESCYRRWRYRGYPPEIPPAQADTIAGKVEDYAELRAAGFTQAQAAWRLGVSRRTIERYAQRLRAGTP